MVGLFYRHVAMESVPDPLLVQKPCSCIIVELEYKICFLSDSLWLSDMLTIIIISGYVLVTYCI